MSRSQLFQYVILVHPTEEESKAGGETKLIVGPDTIIACSQDVATKKAVFNIPQNLRDKLEQIEVIVRPF